MRLNHVPFGVVLYAPKDKEEVPMKLELRVTGDHVFVNMPAEDNGERTWLLMGGGMNELLTWVPERELFRKLIAEGKIKGTNDPETRVDEEGKEVPVHGPGAVIDAWKPRVVTNPPTLAWID